MLPKLGSNMPQIFIQGLFIRDAAGSIIHFRLLEKHIILECVEYAERRGLTLTAYTGDRIVCRATDEHTDRLLFYKEPPPEGLGEPAPHALPRTPSNCAGMRHPSFNIAMGCHAS